MQTNYDSFDDYLINLYEKILRRFVASASKVLSGPVEPPRPNILCLNHPIIRVVKHVIKILRRINSPPESNDDVFNDGEPNEFGFQFLERFGFSFGSQNVLVSGIFSPSLHKNSLKIFENSKPYRYFIII